jgi:hypothetical protein
MLDGHAIAISPAIRCGDRCGAYGLFRAPL